MDDANNIVLFKDDLLTLKYCENKYSRVIL